MFERYSQRARQAIFLARVIAGSRGAHILELDDLIAALILEDQGKLTETLSNMPEFGEVTSRMRVASHIPFFPVDQATELLRKIRDSTPQSGPVPRETDIPLSDTTKRVLNSASDLVEFEAQVGPLHVLAAAVDEEVSNAAHLLREAGVTKQKVISALEHDTS
ncbi:MAG TPA: Clp protease N-terminal domain-containing protein [Candidatus Binataceae bacterium]|nr:Clp protease N-terminal domain-containing protein [Candidatus Binataceae bacterium]